MAATTPISDGASAASRGRWLARCEAVLWLLGAGLLAGAVLYHAAMQREEAAARARFERSLAAPAPLVPAEQAVRETVRDAPRTAVAPEPASVPETDVRLPEPAPPQRFVLEDAPSMADWSAGAKARYRAATPVAGEAVGILSIPALDLEVLVLEGTDERTLDRGAGLIEGTARPGADGNVGIAAHRDGFFRALRHAKVGDELRLRTRKGEHVYVVDAITIVDPDDVSVLAPRERPSLTLVTCYPFWYVGAAPERYIVHASRTQPAA